MSSTKDDILDVSKFSFSGTFEQQLEEVLARVRMTRSEVERLNGFLDDLERIFSKNWPGSHVHPFGSIVTGLGIKTSDIDCYVELPPNFMYNPVKRARSLLSLQRGDRFTNMICINNAKVPILKFVHEPTGCECDLNFSSPHGVRNSKLIAFLLNMDPRALRLAILVKYWSKLYKLAGTNLMPNYGLTMMVIFYLQVKTILPSVEKIQENVDAYFVKSWNTAFNTYWENECTNDEGLYELLGGFFTYYRNFDFDHDVICPYLGYPIKREAFRDTNSLPSFNLYKHNLTYKLCEQMRLGTAVCIQDPFDHSRNCSAAVHPNLLIRIRDYIDNSALRFSEQPKDEYLKELFNLVIPNRAKINKNRRKAEAKYKKQNPHLFVQKTEFKHTLNGRQIMKKKAERAREIFMQYQKGIPDNHSV